MQSIARDSDDSSDEEFFDAHGNDTCDFKLKDEVGSNVYRAQFSKNLFAILLPWLCMHVFNHRSVLKLPRYPACFGAAVEVGGGVVQTPGYLLDELGQGHRPGVTTWRQVQKL